MYWILKSEPSTYSFSDLQREKKTVWDGVRNYQARNNLMAMKKGDQVMIYHSVGPKEIVGIATVTKEHFPDPKDPAWMAVEITYGKLLKTPVTLAELKIHPTLKNLSLVKQSRLSVCPLSEKEWQAITQVAERRE